MTGPRHGDLVASFDPVTNRIDLVGPAPGPAGVVRVELAGGRVQVEYDAAEPATVTLTSAETRGDELPPDVARVLRRLGVASDALPAAGTGPVRLAGPDPSAGMIHARLARLALLAAEIEETALGEQAEALARLELGVIAAGLPDDLGLVPDADALLGAGARGVLALRRRPARWRRIPPIAALVGDAIRVLRRHDPVLAGALAEAVPVAGGAPVGPAAPVPSLALASLRYEVLASAVPPPPDRVAEMADRRRLPVLCAAGVDAEVTRAELVDGHVVVALGAPAAGLWLRVHRRDRRPVPIGFAPVADDGSPARVLLPGGVVATDLIVDVTPRPEEPCRHERTHALRRAVAAGRDALRVQRRADGFAAADRWEECARGWERLGDGRRAGLARRHAVAGLVGTDGPPPGAGSPPGAARPAAPFVFEVRS